MSHAAEVRDSTRGWTVRDAVELYGIHAWGAQYFTVNEKGHVAVCPDGTETSAIDLYALVNDLRRRGFNPPLLVRFSDVLKARVDDLCGAFNAAIRDHEYQGSYRGVYPIKVNQQRHVVEELASYGRPYHLGLEAGASRSYWWRSPTSTIPRRSSSATATRTARTSRPRSSPRSSGGAPSSWSTAIASSRA